MASASKEDLKQSAPDFPASALQVASCFAFLTFVLARFGAFCLQTHPS